MRPAQPLAVLFDLDGTLADTAPDLIAALERIRNRLGLPVIDPAPLRTVASHGAVAILEAGLPELGAADSERLRPEFIEDYRRHCWDRSEPFDGMRELIAALEDNGTAWGVVTNKPGVLAREVVGRAGWGARAACLIAGDSAGRPKPAPDPVRMACRAIGVAPAEALLVGDDERDVIAGRAAGTRTAAALWGYIDNPESVAAWGADCVVASPTELGRDLGVLPSRAAV
jgi:phosphoglycolate phosphatase